jgi:hypothetical protein
MLLGASPFFNTLVSYTDWRSRNATEGVPYRE